MLTLPLKVLRSLPLSVSFLSVPSSRLSFTPALTPTNLFLTGEQAWGTLSRILGEN